MENPQLIRPVVVRTPPELAVTRSHFRPLPYDLLKEASNRLGILCLLAAVLWVVATGLDHIAMKAMGVTDAGLQMSDFIASVSVVVSLALYWYSRKDLREPQFILDLGLIYMVYTAAALGLITPILVGPAAKIREVAEAAGIDLASARIVDVPHSHAAAAAAVALVRSGEAELHRRDGDG